MVYVHLLLGDYDTICLSQIRVMMVNSLQVAPITIHPAFEKAASYFNLRLVHVPLLSDLSPDMDAYKKVSYGNGGLVPVSIFTSNSHRLSPQTQFYCCAQPPSTAMA